jgi:alpha-ketoglutarate-dependent taurine dioxygenase
MRDFEVLFTQGQTIERAHDDLNVELTLDQLFALNVFERIVANAEFRFDIALQEGDVALINNYEVLHSRTAYEDDPDIGKRRLLLRLWIESVVPRPLQPRALKFQNKSGRQGIDPR